LSFEWGEHIGELELRASGASEADVFAGAVAAMAELLGEGDEPGEAQTRELAVAGGDRATLFAAFLEELAFLAETEGFVPAAAEALRLDADGLTARLRGHRGAPPHLVKAVTYHRLAFERGPDGWRASAVLDV